MLIDLSHEIHDGLITYPGLPAPKIGAWMNHEDSASNYSQGTAFHIARIEMIANTGTYLDTPFHRHPDGIDVSGLPLGSIANLPGHVVRIPNDIKGIEPLHLTGISIAGKAVLFHTGWSEHFGTQAYGQGHPFLTEETAQVLINQGAILVGIDSLNIDDTRNPDRPVHTALLSAGIPIVEHLRGLDELPEKHFRFFATPPKIHGMGSFPVRAFALLD